MCSASCSYIPQDFASTHLLAPHQEHASACLRQAPNRQRAPALAAAEGSPEVREPLIVSGAAPAQARSAPRRRRRAAPHARTPSACGGSSPRPRPPPTSTASSKRCRLRARPPPVGHTAQRALCRVLPMPPCGASACSQLLEQPCSSSSRHRAASMQTWSGLRRDRAASQ